MELHRLPAAGKTDLMGVFSRQIGCYKMMGENCL